MAAKYSCNHRAMMRHNLPVDLWREELRDQALVVRLQFGRVNGIVRLGVEIVGVKRPDGGEVLLVLLVSEVGVGTLAMPSVCIS